MAVTALPEHHAAHKASQGHGHVERVGQPGGAEHHRQGTQHKELLGAGPGNLMKERRQEIASHHHEAYEKRQALPSRHGHGEPKPGGPVRRKRWHKNEEEHGRQILEKENPQGRLPVALLQLPGDSQLPGHERRRGQGQAPTNDDGEAQIQPRIGQGACKQRRGEHHLRRA